MVAPHILLLPVYIAAAFATDMPEKRQSLFPITVSDEGPYGASWCATIGEPGCRQITLSGGGSSLNLVGAGAGVFNLTAALRENEGQGANGALRGFFGRGTEAKKKLGAETPLTVWRTGSPGNGACQVTTNHNRRFFTVPSFINLNFTSGQLIAPVLEIAGAAYVRASQYGLIAGTCNASTPTQTAKASVVTTTVSPTGSLKTSVPSSSSTATASSDSGRTEVSFVKRLAAAAAVGGVLALM
jgi:hypothetical protein